MVLFPEVTKIYSHFCSLNLLASWLQEKVMC